MERVKATAPEQTAPATEPRQHAEPVAQRRSRRAGIEVGDVVVQAKLSVGAVGDAYEREADAVAARVVRSLRAGTSTPEPDTTGDDLVDTDNLSEGAGRIRAASASPSPPNAPITFSHIQRAAAIGAQGGQLDGITENAIESARAGGQPLDEGTRSTMEGAFGADFSGVRVHDDQRAGELSMRIQARAFTVGSDIFFSGGVPDVSSRSGQELLAHELTHTIQQSGQAAAQRVVRRRFLDQQQDWLAGSKVSGSLGTTKSRSKELKAVDVAVARWNEAYDLGDVNYMILASKSVLDSIGAWRSSKEDSSISIRAAEIDELEIEARTWNAKTTQWKTDFPARKAQHDQDRATVKAWIDEGAAQDADLRLRNACEWIRNRKTKFYVVTETPDGIERGAAIKGKFPTDMPADTRCYFPAFKEGEGDLWSSVAIYNAVNFRDPTHLDLDLQGAGTKGWNVTGDCIVITEEGVKDGKAATFETLKHEVQHDADKNTGDELSAGIAKAEADKAGAEGTEAALKNSWALAYQAWEASKSASDETATNQAKAAYDTFTQSDDYALRDAKVKSEEALRGYKTEYRAHFYEGRPEFEAETHNLARTITKEGLRWTRRQWKIFDNIRRNYDYVEEAWGDANGTPTAMQTAFRASVASYRNPDTEGFNKYDSARVDDVYNALHLVPAGTVDAKDPKVVALLKCVHALDKPDIDYLLDATQAVMMNQKIHKHLAGAALAAMMAEMEEISVGQSIANLFS